MCTTWSGRIRNAADQIPGERTDRHGRYRTWSMNPASADALLDTLLALSIHALVLDAVSDGRPYTPDMIGCIRLADIEHAATKRPSHELLAGLPTLSEHEQLRVDAVKVLIYDNASALPLARLSQMIRITLMQLTAGLSASDPVCSDVA
ncbi:hypothetical protein ACFY94_07410 [Streptomyces griseorubiginosus]|uniref:hypothetical protein n=1 Tax=Streptomyces griseorubiginosus TaxID=67304 RepID=UPI0036E7FB4E